MTPDEIHRAAELARASQEAERLFVVLMVGFLLIFMFWTLVRWRLNKVDRHQRYRDMALRAETEYHEREAERYWDNFAKRNDLPESTAKVLKATAVKK